MPSPTPITGADKKKDIHVTIHTIKDVKVPPFDSQKYLNIRHIAWRVSNLCK